MQEQIPADTKDNPYPRSKSFFEVFKKQIPKQLKEAQSMGYSSKISELEQQEKEFDMINLSLETGDTGPARKKIASMIRQNLEFIRLGIPNLDLAEETHGERIRQLADYLVELENDPPRTEAATQVETKFGEGVERDAADKVESDTPEVTELKRSIGELEAAEVQIGKSLSDIHSQRKRLNELLRQARLSKLRGDILK